MFDIMDNQFKPAVVVKHLNKSFRLPHDQHSGVKQAIIGVLNGNRGYEEQTVLKDISFEIKKGEFFGIVGRNGSGKSTLLKLLAGIYAPDDGLISVEGTLTPFIELGVGFNPELTGRENVFLNGALLGFSRTQIAGMYEDIVQFSELEKFMDQKLKNYSSGMQVRLAFSIAIKSDSDVLLFDEVLAVGDTEFQLKCFDFFKKIKEDKNKTVILVTHDMGAVQKFCTSALVLHDGKIVSIGNPNEAAVVYQTINFPDKSNSTNSEIQKVALSLVKSYKDNVYNNGDEMVLNISWDKSLVGVKNVGLAIMSQDGSYVFGTNTIIDHFNITEDQKSIRYKVNLNIGGGTFIAKAAVFGDSDDETIYFNDIGITFHMRDKKTWGGVTHLDHEWEY